jgi:hypothetical protein
MYIHHVTWSKTVSHCFISLMFDSYCHFLGFCKEWEMNVQSTMTQILLRIKDFGTIIIYLGTQYWNHLGHKNNDTDSKYIFKHTFSIQKRQFHKKCHFRPKLSQQVNGPFEDKVLIISHKIYAKLPLSIFVQDDGEVTFILQSVSKVTVVTIYVN